MDKMIANMRCTAVQALRLFSFLSIGLSLSLFPKTAHAQTIYHYQDSSGVVHLSDTQTTRDYKPFFYFRLPQNVDKRQVLYLINRNAKIYGLDPALVRAMVEVESGFDIRAVSPKGAQGLMQIMPGTAQDLKLKDSFDASKNIEAGTRYMRQLLDRFGGNVKLAVAAYNAGPGAVSKHGGVPPIAETKNYVEKVKAKYGKAL